MTEYYLYKQNNQQFTVLNSPTVIRVSIIFADKGGSIKLYNYMQKGFQ